jgi:hypothetical protein
MTTPASISIGNVAASSAALGGNLRRLIPFARVGRSAFLSIAPHEPVRVPEMRAAAPFREYTLRELPAWARLSRAAPSLRSYLEAKR